MNWKRPFKWFKKRYVAIGMMATGLLLNLYPENYYLMLVGAFAWYIMWAFAIISTWYFLRRSYWLSVGGYASVLMICMLFGNAWQSGGKNDMNADGLRIAHFNVLKYNYNTAPTVDQARTCGADLISFVEVDDRWATALTTGLKTHYPYQVIESHNNDAYGLAVFSKYPIHDAEILLTEGYPNIVGAVEVEKQRVHFVASHTKAPVGKTNYVTRNKHIALVAEHLAQINGPKIAMGDYNTVPWDRSIAAFKRDSNMSDSRKAHEGTYPSWAPSRIPIDYIFHSEELQCMGFEALAPTASDHLGIIGVYQWKNKPLKS